MTTISASTTIGINLNPALYTSPVVIGAGVTILHSKHLDAVYTDPSAPTVFTINNYGMIIGSDAASGAGVWPKFDSWTPVRTGEN